MSTESHPTNPPAGAATDASAATLAEYRLTPHEQVRVLRRTPELLEVEAHYGAGGKTPPAHRHPKQTEHFTVQEGSLELTLAGKKRVLRAGDTVTVEPGQSHAMAATGAEGARVLWQTIPALKTEQWWAGLDELGRKHDGEPPLPAVARLLRRHHDEFQLALPGPLARVVPMVLSVLPVRG